MNLPQSKNLPINYLSSVFNNTTNSYKFYWFIAILECVRESSEMLIPMSKILAKMISTVWYPVNYFKISFGKLDRLGNIALDVKSESSLAPDSKRYKVVDVVRIILSETSNTTLRQNLNSLMRFVPYRFLRPWFASELKGLTDLSVNSKIIELANKNFHNVKNISMYRFNNGKEKHIELQKLWFNYLVEHNRILMDFSFWNLIKYLQKNNPNVPNIPKKLFAPEARNLKRARNFWDLVLDDYREVSCIYSQLPIIKDKYSIDREHLIYLV